MPISALRELPSFIAGTAMFSLPMPEPIALAPGMQDTVERIDAWSTRTHRTLSSYSAYSVTRRAYEAGVMVGDALRLIRLVRTREIDKWLANASSAERDSFEEWRNEFLHRCDALATLFTDSLVLADLAMPEDGLVAMAIRNPARLARLLSGSGCPVRGIIAVPGVYAATAALVVREWEFFRSFFGRQLRRSGVPVGVRKAKKAISRLNKLVGRPVITERHIEPVIASYAALKEFYIRGKQADELVANALVTAELTSGKPWKGLFRLYDLLVYSGIDPRGHEWEATFAAAMHDPVEYTHVPGREWIIRDYEIGKRLMQMDGKVEQGELWAGIQQGRSSLATGYMRGGQSRTAFAVRYSKPFNAFFDSMVVAEGADHQRQRRAFIPFFTQEAVLSHAPFVEDTVRDLLDDAERIAVDNDGRFDFRSNFAYRFPIRVICHILGFPQHDVSEVQRWAEDSVRSMDTEAGVSMATALAGQRASDSLRAYLEDKLARARAGDTASEVIRIVALDETLSEAERIANLGVLIFAGFETTTGLLSRGVETLLRHKEQWEYLRSSLVEGPPVLVDGEVVPDSEWRWLAWASGQPARKVDADRKERLEALCASSPEAWLRSKEIRRQEDILNRAVEELLRWTAPGTVVPLTASKDIKVPIESAVTIKGCPFLAGSSLTIKKGETVAVAIDELNRRCPVGPGRFKPALPDLFDVSRDDNTAHLSFGLRHSCIGAFLAKENAKRALEGVLRRFPDLELDGVPIPQEMEMFSGLASLPVRSRHLERSGNPVSNS